MFAGLVESARRIDTSSQDGVFLSLLLPTVLFFLLLSFLVRNLSTLAIVGRSCFLSPGLRFFNSGVFHRVALALNGSGVG